MFFKVLGNKHSNCKYEQIKPMKDRSKPINRIDGTASLIDCYFIYQEYKPDYLANVG